MGFDQIQNSRVYRFDVRADGRSPTEVSISADLSIFRDHRVGIQEGPILSGNKLTADLERGWEGEHELTSADVQAYAYAKALADSQDAGARKAHRHRPGVSDETQQEPPWGRRDFEE
jgi:hypothetical protein